MLAGQVKIFAQELDTLSYNSCPREVALTRQLRAGIGDEPMKRAIRIAILIVGLVGTFIVAAVPTVPAADGGPIFLCPPGHHCQANLPPVLS